MHKTQNKTINIVNKPLSKGGHTAEDKHHHLIVCPDCEKTLIGCADFLSDAVHMNVFSEGSLVNLYLVTSRKFTAYTIAITGYNARFKSFEEP